MNIGEQQGHGAALAEGDGVFFTTDAEAGLCQATGSGRNCATAVFFTECTVESTSTALPVRGLMGGSRYCSLLY